MSEIVFFLDFEKMFEKKEKSKICNNCLETKIIDGNFRVNKTGIVSYYGKTCKNCKRCNLPGLQIKNSIIEPGLEEKQPIKKKDNHKIILY